MADSDDEYSHILPSAQTLLALDEIQMRRFLSRRRIHTGLAGTVPIPGLRKLTDEQRLELQEKFNVGRRKGGPLDADAVSRTLEKWIEDVATGKYIAIWPRDDIETPTELSTPEDQKSNILTEQDARVELLRIGGRPAAPYKLLLKTLEDKEAGKDLFWPWLKNDMWGSEWQVIHLPPVFSLQREDWIAFKHKWQWDNRGMVACSESIEGYAKAQYQWHRRQPGREPWESCPDWLIEAEKRSWHIGEKRHFETSKGESFAAYALAVKTRLASHFFTESFELSEDPREQDAWTTWVEYLNYLHWQQDNCDTKVKESAELHKLAWPDVKTLKLYIVPKHWFGHQATFRDIDEAGERLEKSRLQIRNFFADTSQLREREEALRKAVARSTWARRQLALIKMPSTVDGSEQIITESTLTSVGPDAAQTPAQDDGETDAGPSAFSKTMETKVHFDLDNSSQATKESNAIDESQRKCTFIEPTRDYNSVKDAGSPSAAVDQASQSEDDTTQHEPMWDEGWEEATEHRGHKTGKRPYVFWLLSSRGNTPPPPCIVRSPGQSQPVRKAPRNAGFQAPKKGPSSSSAAFSESTRRGEPSQPSTQGPDAPPASVAPRRSERLRPRSGHTGLDPDKETNPKQRTPRSAGGRKGKAPAASGRGRAGQGEDDQATGKSRNASSARKRKRTSAGSEVLQPSTEGSPSKKKNKRT